MCGGARGDSRKSECSAVLRSSRVGERRETREAEIYVLGVTSKNDTQLAGRSIGGDWGSVFCARIENSGMASGTSTEQGIADRSIASRHDRVMFHVVTRLETLRAY
jgi:hypothetical protein